MDARPTCELCGEPMPEGEEMFKFHGYSGSCPKPMKPTSVCPSLDDVIETLGPKLSTQARASIQEMIEATHAVGDNPEDADHLQFLLEYHDKAHAIRDALINGTTDPNAIRPDDILKMHDALVTDLKA